jgi:hypothetical protein
MNLINMNNCCSNKYSICCILVEMYGQYCIMTPQNNKKMKATGSFENSRYHKVGNINIYIYIYRPHLQRQIWNYIKLKTPDHNVRVFYWSTPSTFADLALPNRRFVLTIISLSRNTGCSEPQDYVETNSDSVPWLFSIFHFLELITVA